MRARAYFGPANYSVTSATVNFSVLIPITSTISLAGGNLTLQWSGGLPPYQVQVTTNLAQPIWENVGAETADTSLPLLPSADAAFYRVVGH